MRLDLGTIERFHGDVSDEPDDETVIFIDDDNDKTIHIQCPNAKAVALEIIRAVNGSTR